MHMIRHHFERFDLCLMLFTDLMHDRFEPLIKRRYQHLSPLVRTPDHMRMAGRAPFAVAFVGRLIQKFSIEHRALSVKTFVPDPDRPLLPVPKKELALHPHG
jgi:hypothetical protein